MFINAIVIFYGLYKTLSIFLKCRSRHFRETLNHVLPTKWIGIFTVHSRKTNR